MLKALRGRSKFLLLHIVIVKLAQTKSSNSYLEVLRNTAVATIIDILLIKICVCLSTLRRLTAIFDVFDTKTIASAHKKRIIIKSYLKADE